MSVIHTNIGNSGYYQLNSPSGGAAGSLNHTPSLTSALLQAGSENDVSNFSAAYLLDLSPEAQEYLSGNPQVPLNYLPGDKPTFILSSEQREQITRILSGYKDAPFTQESFNKIQDELNEAGLGPQQLSMIDKSTSFNPTQILINALTGKHVGEASDVNGTKTKAKVDHYLQQIVGQWKSISTTVNEEQASADTTGSDAVEAAGGTSES